MQPPKPEGLPESLKLSSGLPSSKLNDLGKCLVVSVVAQFEFLKRQLLNSTLGN